MLFFPPDMGSSLPEHNGYQWNFVKAIKIDIKKNPTGSLPEITVIILRPGSQQFSLELLSSKWNKTAGSMFLWIIHQNRDNVSSEKHVALHLVFKNFFFLLILNSRLQVYSSRQQGEQPVSLTASSSAKKMQIRGMNFT